MCLYGSDLGCVSFYAYFYLMDFVRSVFVRVINSDQAIFNVRVLFCADFCTDK